MFVYYSPDCFHCQISSNILEAEREGNERIDLMHHDVTRPNGSMAVVVTLKSKIAAGSTSSGGNSKSTDL